jgi:hypothetical protein
VGVFVEAMIPIDGKSEIVEIEFVRFWHIEDPQNENDLLKLEELSHFGASMRALDALYRLS